MTKNNFLIIRLGLVGRLIFSRSKVSGNPEFDPYPSSQTFFGTLLLTLMGTFLCLAKHSVLGPGNTVQGAGFCTPGQGPEHKLVLAHPCTTALAHHCTRGRQPAWPWSWSRPCTRRRGCSYMFQGLVPKPCCFRGPPIDIHSPLCTVLSTQSRCKAHTQFCTCRHTRSCIWSCTAFHTLCCTLVWL